MHIVVYLYNTQNKHTYHDIHSSDYMNTGVACMVQVHVVEVVVPVPCSRRNPPASCCSSVVQRPVLALCTSCMVDLLDTQTQVQLQQMLH